MSRRFAVLKHFLIDSRRLLVEAQAAFAAIAPTGAPTYDEVLRLYRPVHSLKGMSSMVEDGRPLARAFHALEDGLPPLLPTARNEEAGRDWRPLVERTFAWGETYLALLEKKLDLWAKLGADENENRGLLVHLGSDLGGHHLWIPITWIVGLWGRDDFANDPTAQGYDQVGIRESATDGIGIEIHAQTFVLWVAQVGSVCTRLDAVQAGQAMTFKDWIATRGTQAA